MSLKTIYNEIKTHPSNKRFLKDGFLPLYSASPTARIVIVGQAPGRIAQETGVPWNDLSGDKLRKWLGIDRELFYDDSVISLLPMDFYYPGKGLGGDLPPRKEFAPMWHERILKEMPNIEIIILVGQYSQKYYLKDTARENLTNTVKSFKSYLPKFFVLVHPSPLNARWLSKNKWFEKEVIPELQKRIKKIR